MWEAVETKTGKTRVAKTKRGRGERRSREEERKLLRNLINTGKVAAFIDNVIIGTESEERHDELVAEVIKKLEENNIYVKPEKCKWKVRKVGFLRVVIGADRIKMEEEKVKGVLDWPTPKCVKDV